MRVALVGAGGHARVVLDAARCEGAVEVVAVLDAKRDLWGSTFEGLPVVGDEDTLERLRGEGVEGVILGVGSVDTTKTRQILFARIARTGLKLPLIRHPSSVIAASASFGGGTVILANSVVGPAARLGSNVIVNTGALIDHDVVIGDHVHVSPGAHVAGGVRIGTGSHVGIGSTIIQNVTIGGGSMIAAGAVVVRDVSDRSRVGGVPAKPL